MLCGFLDFLLLCVWFCILRSWVSLEWTRVHSLTLLMGCRIGVVYWTLCAINHACLCCDKLKVWYFFLVFWPPHPLAFFLCLYGTFLLFFVPLHPLAIPLSVWYFSFGLLSPSPTSFFFCVFDWTCQPESKVMWICFVPNNKPAVLSLIVHFAV